MHSADGRQQELRVGILQQKSARATANCARGSLVEVEGGQNDDARSGSATGIRCSQDRLGSFDAVHDGHPDVHENDVWARSGRDRDPLDAVGRLADELEVGLG